MGASFLPTRAQVRLTSQGHTVLLRASRPAAAVQAAGATDRTCGHRVPLIAELTHNNDQGGALRTPLARRQRSASALEGPAERAPAQPQIATDQAGSLLTHAGTMLNGLRPVADRAH
jgi:hypothetical protein